MWAVPTILWLISLVLNVGLSSSSCTTKVYVKDFGCYMHWSCSAVTTATTFTVQTKSQGEEWQNVSHCVQITSNSCNLSQVYEDFDLFKFVRLELNLGHDKINLTPQLCDPLKDLNASFSPPYLSLFWGEQQLWVEVTFPCAPYAVCQNNTEQDQKVDDGGTPACCPVTDFQLLNTTVSLYNKHNGHDTQTRTEMVGDRSWKLQFGNITPGQEYCAVARFASSPLSNPQCVHIPSPGHPNYFLLALYGLCCAFPLIAVFLLRRWCRLCASTDLRLPKSLMSVQSQDEDGSIVDEPSPAGNDEEESIVHLSIISLSNLLPSASSSFYPHFQGHVGRYYTTATLPEQFCDENEDTNYYSRNVETDGVSDCESSTRYPWPRWSSLPALKPGMVCLLGTFLPSEGAGIPLSSVRVSEEQDRIRSILQSTSNLV